MLHFEPSLDAFSLRFDVISSITIHSPSRPQAQLCCDLWREKLVECRGLGRDVVRIMQVIAM